MKSVFNELMPNHYEIYLIAESLEEVELFRNHSVDDEAKEDVIQAYYHQAVEDKFGTDAFLAFSTPHNIYPKGIIGIVKYTTDEGYKVININDFQERNKGEY